MGGTIEDTLKHALFLARHLNGCDLQYVTIAVLLELGVPTKRIGFDYLKHAIVLFRENPARMVTKGIYPEVGKLYNPEAGRLQVEQAIRSAINEAWEHRDNKIWGLFFVPDEQGNFRKPSNLEFISRIGYFLELWQGCCKEVSCERVSCTLSP